MLLIIIYFINVFVAKLGSTAGKFVGWGGSIEVEKEREREREREREKEENNFFVKIKNKQ
jgi:hypothetical protein